MCVEIMIGWALNSGEECMSFLEKKTAKGCAVNYNKKRERGIRDRPGSQGRTFGVMFIGRGLKTDLCDWVGAVVQLSKAYWKLYHF